MSLEELITIAEKHFIVEFKSNAQLLKDNLYGPIQGYQSNNMTITSKIDNKSYLFQFTEQSFANNIGIYKAERLEEIANEIKAIIRQYKLDKLI